MNPKKSKEFIPTVADELNISQKLVEDMLTYYWKDVKQSMLKGLSPNIVLQGFGTFKARPWKLPDTLAKYERIYNKYKTLTDNPETASFQKFTILKETEQRLEILNNLQEMINQESNKQKDIKHKRYVEKNKDNMGE